MDLDTFCGLPVTEQSQLINQKTTAKTPFYLERLQTAIENNSLMPLVFLDERLVKIYDNIKNKTK